MLDYRSFPISSSKWRIRRDFSVSSLLFSISFQIAFDLCSPTTLIFPRRRQKRAISVFFESKTLDRKRKEIGNRGEHLKTNNFMKQLSTAGSLLTQWLRVTGQNWNSINVFLRFSACQSFVMIFLINLKRQFLKWVLSMAGVESRSCSIHFYGIASEIHLIFKRAKAKLKFSRNSWRGNISRGGRQVTSDWYSEWGSVPKLEYVQKCFQFKKKLKMNQQLQVTRNILKAPVSFPTQPLALSSTWQHKSQLNHWIFPAALFIPVNVS